MNQPTKRGRGQPPKPPELRKRNATFKLSPANITRLEEIDNKSRFVDGLLTEYFERMKENVKN